MSFNKTKRSINDSYSEYQEQLGEIEDAGNKFGSLADPSRYTLGLPSSDLDDLGTQYAPFFSLGCRILS